VVLTDERQCLHHDFAVFTNISAQNEIVDKDIAVNVYWRQKAYMCVLDKVQKKVFQLKAYS